MQRNEFHLHIHEGAPLDAVRVAVETYNSGQPGDSVAPTADMDGMEEDEASQEVSTEALVALATRAYTESEGNMKPLLEFLAENPDRLVSYTEASEALNFPSNLSMPGLLGAFGRRANHRYGGAWPFKKAIWANEDSNFLMTEIAANAIRDARRA